MKIFKLTIALAVLTVFSGEAQESLEAMRAKYDERLTEIQTGFEKKKLDVFEQYTRTLEVLENRAKAKGDLDTVLLVKGEQKRVNANKEINATNFVESAEDLMEMQSTCLEMYKKLEAQKAVDIVKLWGMYDAALKKLEKGLTAKDQLAEALKIREERQNVGNSKTLLDARRIIDVLKSDSEKESVFGKKKLKSANHLSSQSVIVEGFGELISASSTGMHTTYRGNATRASYLNPDSGSHIEWKTPKVVADVFTKEVVFIWAGACSKPESEYNLFLNGKFLMTFESGVLTSKSWKTKFASLRFEVKKILDYRCSGIYTLTVPVQYVIKGQKQTIKITSSSKSKARSWIMLYSLKDVLKDLPK